MKYNTLESHTIMSKITKQYKLQYHKPFLATNIHIYQTHVFLPQISFYITLLTLDFIWPKLRPRDRSSWVCKSGEK